MSFVHSLLKNNIMLLYDIFQNDPIYRNMSESDSFLEKSFCSQQMTKELPHLIQHNFSQSSSNILIQKEITDEHDFIPFEILITGGLVSIMLFYHDCDLPELSEIPTSLNTGASNNIVEECDTSVDPKDIPKSRKGFFDMTYRKRSSMSPPQKTLWPYKLHPFLCVVATQPHSYLVCHPSSQKFESSCFDLQLTGAPPDHTIQKPLKSYTTFKDDFSISYLETKPGEPNPKTGIPPAFFTTTWTDIFSKSAIIKVSVERPVKISMRKEIGESAFSFMQCLQTELSKFSEPIRDVTASNSDVTSQPMKFRLMNYLKNVTLSTTQVVLEFDPSLSKNSDKLALHTSNVEMKMDIETYKDNVRNMNLKADLTSLILQVHSCNQIWNILQPLTFSLLLKCHLSPWFQVELSLNGQSVLLNISLYYLLKVKNVIEVLMEQLQKQVKFFESIIPYNYGKDVHVSSNECKDRRMFSDDLRKGLFQFIQVNDDHNLQPKVHEIVFNNASANHPASMTWCYPEPRALVKIEISPVPFQCGDKKDSQALTCYLQYWNSASNEYTNLCDFPLSETEHACLDLPDLNSDFISVSDKWRVLLDCRNYIDDAGVLEKERPCLSPLALAACMSIDSCFDPSLIPLVEIRASFDLAKVTLFNHFERKGFTPMLYPFEFDDESPCNQEFSTVSFLNPNCFFTAWISKLKGEMSSGCSVEMMEYRNLTMLPVISPVDLNCNAVVNSNNEKYPIVDVELVLHPCFVRVTQSIVHTLTYTLQYFSRDVVWSSLSDACQEYMLPNYYLICNNLQENIRFGQTETEEYIILSPLKVHAYSWWCHKSTQKLRISLGCINWKWSEDFSIDEEGTQAVAVDNSRSIIVKIKKLSNLQRQVIIDGQLSIHTELNFPIQVKCDFPAHPPLKGKTSGLHVIKSLTPQSSMPAFLLSWKQCQNMNISITGILDSQLWSESIVFGDTKLIKIPYMNDASYQNAWCQVVEQKLLENFSSIMVFICPLFVLRNNLPIPLKVEVTAVETKETYSVDLLGKGQEVKLKEGSNWDHKLQLNFHSLSDIRISPFSLSVSISDLAQITLKPFQENENVEMHHKMLFNLDKFWPYSYLEKSENACTLDCMYTCAKQSGLVPAIASKNVYSKLKVDRCQRWVGLNTILLDIKPHAILVNRLRINLHLFNKDGMQWKMPPNSVAMLSVPEESFQLAILEKETYFHSCSLTLDENIGNKISHATESDAHTYCNKSVQLIPHNGSINVLIRIVSQHQKICLFKLKSEIHEGILIITAFPVFILHNKINKLFHLACHCIPSNAKEASLSLLTCDSSFCKITEEYHPLLFWTEVGFVNSSTAVDYLELNFYISISFMDTSERNWSHPIILHSKLNDNSRYAVSVPTSESDVPVVASCHKHKGMVFLVLNKDPCPLLLLHNRTKMNICYGQSIQSSEGKSVFEEMQLLQIIPTLNPDTSSYYTFPIILEKFPNLCDKMPKLCLGVKNESDGKYVWSVPFRVNVDNQFVHIHDMCDVMIVNRQHGHTINLFIEPVNRIEFTAKEVRSRIALATDSSDSVCEENEQKPRTSIRKVMESKIRNKPSISNNKEISLSSRVPYILYTNLRIIHISFIICDEFKEANKSVETLRLNIDNAVLFTRPVTEKSVGRLQEVFLCFEQVQLDNQLDNEGNMIFDFPVILQRHKESAPKPSAISDVNAFLPNKVRENSMFILNTSVEFPNEECDDFVLHTLSVHLLPVSLCVEDTFFFRVTNLLKSYIPITFHQHNIAWQDIYIPKHIASASSSFINPVHFQHLVVDIQEVSLSLHTSLKLYLSLENSVLRFQPFEKSDLFTTPYEIGRVFVLHYLTGALFRAGWVVGSLDLLGNPAGFVRAVGAGMSDFVYLPYRGLFIGPRAFVSGLSHGALSLFTQISSGALTCVTNLATSISKNMDFLCLDNEHLARQELVRRQLPSGLSEGLVQGLSVLGLSLLGAIAGIVDHPLQVMLSPSTPMKTASGIVGGFGKGIIGIFTKPIGGAAELLSQTGYGLLHGAGWLSPPKRQYPPVSMPLRVGTSSCLKYLCKIAQCSSLGEVLLQVEATYINENDEYERNILLLTSEALCILADDEVTLQRTFALTEINCRKAERDQSTLVIIPNTLYKRASMESYDGVDRVVEYVTRSRLEASEAETSGNSQDSTLDILFKSSSCFVFFVYPRDRNLFFSLFSYAKNKSMGKGFFPEC